MNKDERRRPPVVVDPVAQRGERARDEKRAENVKKPDAGKSK